MYERYTDERLLGHHSLPELSMPQGVGNTICSCADEEVIIVRRWMFIVGKSHGKTSN